MQGPRFSPTTDAILDAFHARIPVRTGSLIVTIFGDAIAPRGGEVPLSALLPLLDAMRIGESQARTALSRLVAEGWLERERSGRTSRYRLSGTGAETFTEAATRIYGAVPGAWDGRLHLALIETTGGAERARVRAALEADGFGGLTSDLLVSTRPGTTDGALALLATAGEAELRRLAARAWPLDDLAQRYRAIAALFADARDAAPRIADPLEALILRVLVVHEYRRAVLRDPILPEALLPPDWPGREARETCAAIYRLVAPLAERWLDMNAFPDTATTGTVHLADRFAA